jgi:hypothetical protein
VQVVPHTLKPCAVPVLRFCGSAHVFCFYSVIFSAVIVLYSSEIGLGGVIVFRFCKLCASKAGVEALQLNLAGCLHASA